MRRTPAIQAADLLASHAHRAFNRGSQFSRFYLEQTGLSGIYHEYFGKDRILRMFDKVMAEEAEAAEKARRGPKGGSGQ
jgi:hypothetical protein